MTIRRKVIPRWRKARRRFMIGGKARTAVRSTAVPPGMPILADDDVIVHGDAKRACDVDDCFHHLDVGLRWRWHDAPCARSVLEDLFEVISTNAACQRLIARLLGNDLVQQPVSCVPVQLERSRL
jgi:hypothetical protein